MKITVDLNDTLKDVKTLRKRLDRSGDYLTKLCVKGQEVAQNIFATAQYDGTNDVIVSFQVNKDDASVIARGNAVTFIEFGTGVHYTQSHPLAGEMGAIRGEFGYKLGQHDSWRYEGSPGTNGEVIQEGKHKGEVKTHGNPPASAMYNASKEMRKNIIPYAKEVFNK